MSSRHTKETLSRQVGLDNSANLTDCLSSNQTVQSRDVCEQTLKSQAVLGSIIGECCCRQPDSGELTVRDERGALRKRGL